jgi:hypothetical protein
MCRAVGSWAHAGHVGTAAGVHRVSPERACVCAYARVRVRVRGLRACVKICIYTHVYIGAYRTRRSYR